MISFSILNRGESLKRKKEREKKEREKKERKKRKRERKEERKKRKRKKRKRKKRKRERKGRKERKNETLGRSEREFLLFKSISDVFFRVDFDFLFFEKKNESKEKFSSFNLISQKRRKKMNYNFWREEFSSNF